MAKLQFDRLGGDERLPRYQRLADHLREEIGKGAWRPGDRMPSESELAEMFAIAPGTTRQAITQLVNDGVLERFQGKGTFVRRPRFDHWLFRFFRFRGKTGESVVPESRILKKSVEPMPSFVAMRLNVAAASEAICISRLRLIDTMPVLIEEIWLPLPAFDALREVEIPDGEPLLYPLYDELCGHVVTNAEEELTAEAATTEHAKPLKVKRGDPLIVIERLARGYDGTPLEWRRSRGRADHFHYHTEIR